MLPYNINHLHYFVTVVEQGKITQAARTLNKDRSLISNAINCLEIDLNITLFDRSGRRIELTAEGKKVYRRAKTLLHNCQNLFEYSQSINDEIEHEITIGYDSFTSYQELAYLEKCICDQFPHVIVNWQAYQSGFSATMQEQLKLDLVIQLCSAVDSDQYNTRGFSNNNQKLLDPIKLTAVTSVSSFNNLTQPIDFLDLRSLPLVTFADIESVVSLDQINMVQFVENSHCALEIAKSKPSWTLLPSSMATYVLQTTEFMQLDVDLPCYHYANRVISWPESACNGKVVSWLIDNVQQLLSLYNSSQVSSHEYLRAS